MAGTSSPCTIATRLLPPARNGFGTGGEGDAGAASGENSICRSIWRHAGTVTPSAANPARVSRVRRVSFTRSCYRQSSTETVFAYDAPMMRQ